MNTLGHLHCFCGKAASGKSTLAQQLAAGEGTVLMAEDVWLTRLFPDEIGDLKDYVTYSKRLRSALQDHIVQLLRQGVSVVLDFPGNTLQQRAWFRSLIQEAACDHTLHYIDASDALCKRQLHQRNQDLPDGNVPLTDEAFDLVTSYFQAPDDDEGFHVRPYLHH